MHCAMFKSNCIKLCLLMLVVLLHATSTQKPRALFLSISLPTHMEILIQTARAIQDSFDIYFPIEDELLPKLSKSITLAEHISLGKNVTIGGLTTNELVTNLENASNGPIFFGKQSLIIYKTLKPLLQKWKAENTLPQFIFYDIMCFTANMFSAGYNIPLVSISCSVHLNVGDALYKPPGISSAVPPLSLFSKFYEFALNLQNLITVIFPIVSACNELRAQFNETKLSIPIKPHVAIIGHSRAFDYHFQKRTSIFYIGSFANYSMEKTNPSMFALAQEYNDFIGNAVEKSSDSVPPVIYCAFGTVATMSEELIQKFVDAFNSIPQYKVIWAMPLHKRSKYMDKLLSHVKVVSFAPQLALLADSRVKLFISHCGGNSVTEAMHLGKPVLGFPFFGDQHAAAGRVEYRRVGKQMDKDTVSANQMKDAIIEIVSNEHVYLKNAQQISKITYEEGGVEQVAKIIKSLSVTGVEYLQEIEDNMPLYERLQLDLAVIVILPIFIAIYVLKKLISCCCRI